MAHLFDFANQDDIGTPLYSAKPTYVKRTMCSRVSLNLGGEIAWRDVPQCKRSPHCPQRTCGVEDSSEPHLNWLTILGQRNVNERLADQTDRLCLAIHFFGLPSGARSTRTSGDLLPEEAKTCPEYFHPSLMHFHRYR